MSSPLDLALMQLEANIIPSFGFPIPIYFRYVDDILRGVSTEKFNHTLQISNSYHNRSLL